ncbi:hypothetical protein CEXT_365031 [Caerostris extrusa]|uniref:Uncharacterized protein n=1 Tax=Caerostris extrusa TaxID=172846 RepID=A0AAV4SYP9_CAEEX|nr:hypothetical protein CEXT_365031 [Caerostris extrusa]
MNKAVSYGSVVRTDVLRKCTAIQDHCMQKYRKLLASRMSLFTKCEKSSKGNGDLSFLITAAKIQEGIKKKKKKPTQIQDGWAWRFH